MSTEFIVLSHDAAGNALGRAQSLALVAQELGRTEVWAVERDGWWSGASQFDTRNVGFPAGGAGLAEAVRRFRTPGARLVVWITKGVRPLPRWAAVIGRVAPDALALLDVDDDDAGLAEDYRRRSILRRATLHRLRAGHPAQIRAAQRELWSRVDAITYASEAVRSAYPAPERPAIWVPHVRPDHPPARRGVPGRVAVRVGAFGTIRPHKGRQLILDLIRRHRDVEVHAFRGSGLGVPGPADRNWIEVDPRTPLPVAYEGVDAALLPMTTGSAPSDVQFPAKLVDAMRAGVAIVASPTTAVREIAGDAFVPLGEPATADGARAAIEVAVARADGDLARRIYLENLTPGVVAERLSGALDGLIERTAVHD